MLKKKQNWLLNKRFDTKLQVINCLYITPFNQAARGWVRTNHDQLACSITEVTNCICLGQHDFHTHWPDWHIIIYVRFRTSDITKDSNLSTQSGIITTWNTNLSTHRTQIWVLTRDSNLSRLLNRSDIIKSSNFPN